jgi:hypothetical protein
MRHVLKILTKRQIKELENDLEKKVKEIVKDITADYFTFADEKDKTAKTPNFMEKMVIAQEISIAADKEYKSLSKKISKKGKKK